MTADRDNEDDDVVARLRAMPRDLEPPAGLETRLTARLIASGDLRDSPSRDGIATRVTRLRLAAAAAIVLAFLGGWLAGSNGAAPPAPPQHRYVFLLYPGAAPPASAGDDVAAYRDWARRLRAEGHAVSGERLAARPIPTETPQTEDPLEGYFVIDAASDRDALAIASTHPHVRRGGRIVVRYIEPT